jgi:CDP-glycerol glycerophosphotransferase
MPDVSVVVIVFNDAARLPAAVQSALTQDVDLEVVLVDDGSTDATPAVVAELADDVRVRPVRLASNSGGCSLPRNTGLHEARGTWVTFLDSDDVLEPGALATMLAHAGSTGADVVSGLVRRCYDDGTLHEWKPDLHRVARTVTARELPRVLHDTLAPGKLYSHALLSQHGIEFPLGVLFEDYLFSALVYAHAQRIALIPEPVYRWNVVVGAEQASITQRLHDVRSFADRLAAHRLATDALHEAGCGELADELDHKFLTHDLRLYVRHLHARDADYLARVRDLALPFVLGVSPTVLARLGASDVLALEGLKAGDFSLVALAARIHYRGLPREPRSRQPRPAPALVRRPAIWVRAGLRAARAGRH